MPSEPLMPAIDTERLHLRRQQVEDAGIFRQLWAERDPRVPPHRQISTDGRPTEDDIVAQIRTESEDTGPGLLSVVRKETGDVIGYCGVVFHGNGEADDPEIAFELLRAVHNQGYATEAGHAVIDWARNAGYRRMWASVWDWNLASRRTLEKLGFHDTGRINPPMPHGRNLLTTREL